MGGFRAASVDYFPVVGKIIDVNETLRLNPKIVKGETPKGLSYIRFGLYTYKRYGAGGFQTPWCAPEC